MNLLATFAGHVKRLRRPRVLVDGTRFMMDPANLNDVWRDASRGRDLQCHRHVRADHNGERQRRADRSRLRSRLHRGRKVLQRELWHIAEAQGITAAAAVAEAN